MRNTRGVIAALSGFGVIPAMRARNLLESIPRSCLWAGSGLAVFAAVWVGAGIAGPSASASVQPTEFTVAADQPVVEHFGGFGAQFNQHVFADISGPPPNVADLETKVLAGGPQFARIFFNASEWTFPDRMASFLRTVVLARRAQAQINITWQGGTPEFALDNMSRFADVLTDLLTTSGVDSLWVTLFNEPNSTKITLPQYEQVYRTLDAALRVRGVRDRVHFMGGDLVGTLSPLGQTQGDWFSYMATHMGDLLEAWSIHVYWDFWDPGKIDRRLLTEVRTIYDATPPDERRPLYVTEFGVRGIPTLEGETDTSPGLWPDGTPLEQTTSAGFEEAWFMVRAAELGYSAMLKWDMYDGKYDNGVGAYSVIGPGVDGWPLRSVYRLLQLFTTTTSPTGGETVTVVPAPGADPKKLLAAYLSPGSGLTVLGLDTDGGVIESTANTSVPYSIGGLPPNRLFRLFLWNGDGTGTNIEIGFIDSGPSGTISFAAPLHAVFALTDTSLGPLPW
jgi:hypothetical protein